MSHFHSEGYCSLRSPLHCWEPRVRLISLFILILSVAMARDIGQALAGLSVSISLILISRLPLSYVTAFLKWPIIFLLPLLMLLPFTAGEDVFFSLYHLKPSIQGFLLGLLFLLRGLSAALLALMIVGTSPFNVTISALSSMGLPGHLTQIFLFAYRYVFLLDEELQSMSRSLSSRRFVKRSDLRTARILSLAVAMLFIRSYQRSENVFHAMLSRGYQGELPSGRRQMIKRDDLIKGFLVIGAALLIHAF
ncbi:MAG: cobalt ECF transporter T component CbiQ [Methanothrix sp.]